MRPSIRPVLTACLLLAALVGLSACASTNTGDKGYVVGGGVITKLPAGQRKTPGTLSGTTLEGKKVALSQYAGHVVVVNVWGSWCADCRAEAGALSGAARDLSASGVRFLGIDTRDSSPDQALAFQRRFEVPYSSLYDPAGRSLLAFHGIIPLSAIPSTVVIDAHGRVAASIVGALPSRRTLVELVQDVAS